MSSLPQVVERPQPTEFDSHLFCMAYLFVCAARCEARMAGAHPWQYSVKLGNYFPESVIHWLLFQGHIDHFRRYPNPVPTPVESMQLHDDSCFIVTDLGYDFACVFMDFAFCDDPDEKQRLRDMVWLGVQSPLFDGAERTLEWGHHLIKHFTQPAQNQELVVAAAEELHWPIWFDDPLPRGHCHNSKVRLHDTIKDLNRRPGRNGPVPPAVKRWPHVEA